MRLLRFNPSQKSPPYTAGRDEWNCVFSAHEEAADFSPRSFTSAIIFIPIFLFMFNGHIFAGQDVDKTIQELRQKIEELEEKVDTLNKKLSIYEERPSVSVPDEAIQEKVDNILSKKEEAGGGLAKALKDISLSGFVDTSYVYNTNRPDTGTNTARVFDTDADSFNLQAAKIAFEKLPAKTGGAGFRADLLAGEDAKVLNNATYGFIGDGHFDLEQVYVDMFVPVGKGLDIKAGKFVTLAGAEVIESKDNWNFSRSLLFGYAIPFTHTGLRMTYPLNDRLSGIIGVNNGWDNVKDNNKSKSVESGLSWAVGDWLSFSLSGMFGPEQPSNNHSNRALVDFVGTYKPLEKLAFKLNTDYVHEEDGVSEGKNGSWSGVAFYTRYDFNSWMSLIDRVEFFSDPDGLRIASGVPEDLWENTATVELRPFEDLITRLEYRYDRSSQDIFTKRGDVIDYQGTIGIEAIYVF